MNGTVSALLPGFKRTGGWPRSSALPQNKGICALLLDERMMLGKPLPKLNNAGAKNRRSERQQKISGSKLEAMRLGNLLASSLDALDVGLEIWDKEDKLALYNNKITQLYAGFHTSDDIGLTFEELTRAKLSMHLIKTEIGNEEQWMTQRLLNRGKNKGPFLHELPGDRWVNAYETRTPEGYLAVAWVEVTELVRKGRVLESINHQLAHQSATDGLTGLANRRRFDEALATEWQPGTRNATPLSLLMVDIDHFKLYNDHYGHLAGDECLRQVAKVLNQCVRRNGELVARFGGEEFVILLPGSDMHYARETAQKCLDLMREAALPHSASPLCGRVTLSIGVASLQADATLDVALMLNAADAAMYRAKSDGRACFKTAGPADWKINKDTPRTDSLCNQKLNLI